MSEEKPTPENTATTIGSGFRFGIRSLFLWTVIFSGLFALGKWAGLVWAFGAGWLVLLISAHVVGNALGKKRYGKRETRQVRDMASADTDAKTLSFIRQQAGQEVRAVTIGKLCRAITIAGAILGAGMGAGVMMWASRGEPMYQAVNAIALTTVSGAVLGGFLGFFASSFVDIFRGYLHVADEGLRADEDRKRKAAERWMS